MSTGENNGNGGGPPDERERERPSTGVPDVPMGGASEPSGSERNIPPTRPPPFGDAATTTGPYATLGPRSKRPSTLFGDQGPVRRFLSRWGFPLFVLVVVILGRKVLLPFVFAALIAYILAPVVRWMTE